MLHSPNGSKNYKKIVFFVVVILGFGCLRLSEAMTPVAHYGKAFYRLGQKYGLQDKKQKALIAYEKASYFDPGLADVYYEQGKIYFEKRDYQRAIQLLQMAISQYGGDLHGAYHQLGLTYREIGAYTRAEKSFQKAIELGQNRCYSHYGCPFGYWYELGVTYQMMGEGEKALYQAALISARGDPSLAEELRKKLKEMKPDGV
ncbi:MAG: tetratricopeptide repeat protein [Candidatus Omnitrophica bacterium]|nr:tetratricopeptide repeat protein [Candidatus Omnitrophota bacterium]